MTNGGRSGWYMPVSYTHLDVYKRQVWTRAGMLGNSLIAAALMLLAALVLVRWLREAKGGES